MGLLDKLFDKGAKALGDMVSDKVSDMLNADESGELRKVVQTTKTAVSSALGQEQRDTWEEPGSRSGMGGSQSTRVQEKSFEQKVQEILQRAGDYTLRENVSPEELEQEFGREIFTRSRNWCSPDAIDYAVYQGGNRVLMIRMWECYTDYNHKSNRQIKEFCDANGVKMLDFFAYLPNEEDYMEQRIREQLV